MIIKEGSVKDLIIDKKCEGVKLDNGEIIWSDSTVITTGTFLGGVCHIGKQKFQGGWFLWDDEGLEPPSNDLALTFWWL